MTDFPFPDGFIWGTATSAYQIEGATQADGRIESIWDRFCHTAGKIDDGSNADIATDHFHRWEEDFDLLQRHGLRHYRFSLAWPRLMDEQGQPNPKGIDFYNRLIDGLLVRNITPWVTIYHWDLPQHLQDIGGWTNRGIVDRFCEYAELAYRSFGDRVSNWIVLNEPSTAGLLGYGYGFYAPGMKGEKSYRRLSTTKT